VCANVDCSAVGFRVEPVVQPADGMVPRRGPAQGAQSRGKGACCVSAPQP